jgi:hypothetical protein
MRNVGTLVIVDKYCLSSCANYLFLAAKEKSLMPNAVLGFHGGFFFSFEDVQIENDDNETSIGMKTALQKLLKTDTTLLLELGIDNQIFRDSYELTKVEARPLTITIKTSEKTFVFTKEQIEEMNTLLSQLGKDGTYYDYSITPPSTQSTSKAYFPSKDTLTKKYHVKGIAAYPYPTNRDEMNKVATEIDQDLVIVGDF